jgi:hypothetical protein
MKPLSNFSILIVEYSKQMHHACDVHDSFRFPSFRTMPSPLRCAAEGCRTPILFTEGSGYCQSKWARAPIGTIVIPSVYAEQCSRAFCRNHLTRDDYGERCLTCKGKHRKQENPAIFADRVAFSLLTLAGGISCLALGATGLGVLLTGVGVGCSVFTWWKS